MEQDRPLFIPVILGTPRRGRRSLFAARLVTDEITKRPGLTSELLDVAEFRLPYDDAGEQIKHPAFAERMERADAIVIVCPEYNHGYPGPLKHLLDSCLREYIHKAAGVVGVSAGPWGGTRAIEALLPVLRELGLVTIFWDVNFSSVQKVFDAEGKLLEPAFPRRIEKFLTELVWMARTLRQGREHLALDEVPGGSGI